MYKIKGLQSTFLNNIPRNMGEGYKDTYGGKVYNKDGSFIFFYNLSLIGENDSDTSIWHERVGGYALEFEEVPCDEEGNPLIISHFFTRTKNDNKIKISILCSKEPTHRVNLLTGEITDNNADNQYIRSINILYFVYDTNVIAI